MKLLIWRLRGQEQRAISGKTDLKIVLGTKFGGLGSRVFSHRLTLETDSDVIKGSERLSDFHLHTYGTALFGLLLLDLSFLFYFLLTQHLIESHFSIFQSVLFFAFAVSPRPFALLLFISTPSHALFYVSQGESFE